MRRRRAASAAASLLPLVLALALALGAGAFHHHAPTACWRTQTQQLPRSRQRGGLCMRHQPSGAERERGIEEKQLREKQSQVMLAQRVQHIKRLRQARRADIVETEWYSPKQPNHDWRNAVAGAGATAAAAPEEAGKGAAAAATAPPVDEIAEMIGFKAERGSGGAVVNVYAGQQAAGSVVDGSGGVVGGGQNVVRAPLRRNDYAPLAAWRDLRYIDAEGLEAAASYNRMRNASRYVVVLAGVAPEGLVVEGLKRMRIVPPQLAAVVGVSPTPPHEAVRLVKKHGLAPGALLSDDADRRWLAAHGVGGPRSLRPIMLVLDGPRGVVLSVVRDPAPGSVNDLLADIVGDWRGGGGGGL